MNDENTTNNSGEELEDNIIVLNDENGEESRFEFLDLIELDNEEYVVLLPVEDTFMLQSESVMFWVPDTVTVFVVVEPVMTKLTPDDEPLMLVPDEL